MALMRYRKQDPFKALEDLQEEINRLFDTSLSLPKVRDEIFIPSVDISEDKDNVYVDVDIPGLEQKDIKVSLNKGILVISGSKQESKEEKNKNYHRIERFQGSFLREIPLDSNIDASQVKARYKNGVLHITLPKKEEEKTKSIEVRVE